MLCSSSAAQKLKKFQPLPAAMENPANPLTDDRIRLGRMLYFDPRLSLSKAVSCNSCHPLDRYGMDGTAVSTGHKQQKGGRNAPTVYNAAGHASQFWDGRAKDVEEQAKGPILNPIEMAMPSEAAVLEVLRGIPGYVEAFRKAFPGEAEPLTYDNVGKAIGAFERKLVTPARWDRYLAGEKDALTPAEKKGFDRFYAVGCVDCHQGAYAGGGEAYKILGIEKTYEPNKDMGRFNVTKVGTDRYAFKVPSLRNIEKTGPYLHDGTIATLEECVRLMGTYQLGKRLSDGEVTSIVTWLKSLTGELPAEYIRAPALPK
ncbi:MAG: cytochrome-c peroxidase [Bryobacterales bacterium]|nr:cytochrome-c peroxidase [Bryobacterales bacterium]